MKWFEGKFVQAINRRHDRVGPLFQGRFKSQLVEKGSYLLGLIRYIALNPVRAGMVKNPEQYKWSSCRWLAGFEKAPGPRTSWSDPGLHDPGLHEEMSMRLASGAAHS